MRLVSKCIFSITNYAIKVNKTQVRNFAKVLNQEHVIQLNQETLTGRILLYLNIDSEKCYNPLQNTPQFYQDVRHNVNNLYKFNNEEIINFLNNVNVQDINKNEFTLIVNKLDIECCLRLIQLDNKSVLKLLNIFMNLVPNRITDLKFYKSSINKLFENIPVLSKNELLQTVFYIGLQKKTAKPMLRKCIAFMGEDFINNLTAEELCIICNSTFKTSTKITNKILLDKVRNYLNENLIVLKDPALFITLVKTMRHNKYQDENLLATISCTISFNKTLQYYSFPGICHIMALYSDYLYYDEQLLKIFVKKCLEELEADSFNNKHNYLTQQLRGKDIKRFLWCLSNFNEFKLITRSDLDNIVIPKLLDRIKRDEFDNDPDSLVDIMLFLWMLNYRSYNLVPHILTQNNVRMLGTKSKSKLRLNLLLYCIAVEDPELYNKLTVKPTNYSNEASFYYQLKQRPLLTKLLQHLKIIGNLISLKFEIIQAIPHLTISGICGYKSDGSKAVHVEILDDSTQLKNVEEHTPGGLMSLKLRLLNNLDEGVLVVSQGEIEDMTEAELHTYLLEELQLICP